MINDRKYYENLEQKNFKPYAVISKFSKGRKFAEEADQYRTVFQRDRDRIVHSKAFRRLKYKTQVFVIFEGDHYRTRLSHTLEVAQIARHIARMLGINEDLVESISLAHDLGHTPFGHAGEEQLDDLLQDAGGFEHNLQSKRIVELLENKYPDFPGLNLSQEVLDGLMKHFTPFDHPANTLEKDIVHPSLEAQVVNLADQLAYVNHDLDDGIASGILNMDELVTEVDLWREAQISNEHQYKNFNAEQIRFLNVRYLINLMVLEAVHYSTKRIKDLNIKTLQDVYSSDERIVDYSAGFKKRVIDLQTFLYSRFYNDYRVLRMSIKGKRFIKDLFDQFNTNPELMPKTDFQKIENGENQKRVIADYISQMTDNFVVEEHKRIFEIEKEAMN
ncbi:MAG: deoxyguanosinetriphosphate triphosphohydrolase [Candidatus Margulisbacteria bacterium]|nr:deoxyguanosinetriphosphate triphosphohydrolase [Candidatus Margulisiibacteriota bacterium]